MPALKRGKVLISVICGLQHCLSGRRPPAAGWWRNQCPAIDGCLPNLTLLLQMGAAEAITPEDASEVDRIEMMDNGFHKRVRSVAQLAEQHSERIVPIDAKGNRKILLSGLRATYRGMQKAGIP